MKKFGLAFYQSFISNSTKIPQAHNRRDLQFFLLIELKKLYNSSGINILPQFSQKYKWSRLFLISTIFCGGIEL